MKKVVLSLVGVAVAGALIAPTFIGQHAEREIKAIAEAIDANPIYSVKLVSYERSWFSAQGVLNVAMELPLPQQDGSTKTVSVTSGDVVLEVQHGPLLTRFDGGLGLLSWQLTADDDTKRTTLEWSEEQPLYQLTGSMGLTGEAAYEDTIADVVYRGIDDDMVVEVTGYQGNGTFGSDGFTYNGLNQSLAIGDAAVSFTMNDIALQTAAKGTLIDALNGELLESDIAFSIANAKQGSDDVFVGMEVSGASELSETGDTLSIAFETSLERMQLPTGGLSDFVMNVSMNRIDVKFMQAYQQLINATYGQPQEVMEQQLSALFEQYQEQVLSAQPELAITKFSGQLPAGAFSGSARATFAEIGEFPANPTTEFWLQHMIAEGAIEAAKPLVKDALRMQLTTVLAQQMPDQDISSPQFQDMINRQVEQVVAVYLQQGFIVENEQQYHSEVELKQGSLTLNGKPLPLM